MDIVDLRELRERLAPAADLSDAAFPFSTHRLLAVAGCDGVRAVRITFMGELGWELHVPREEHRQHGAKGGRPDSGLGLCLEALERELSLARDAHEAWRRSIREAGRA